MSNYGFCPICNAAVTMRERSITGNDTCINGHKFKSSLTKKQADEIGLTKTDSFCHNPKCRLNKVKASYKFYSEYDQSGNMIEYKRELYVRRDRTEIYLCDVCANAILLIKKRGE